MSLKLFADDENRENFFDEFLKKSSQIINKQNVKITTIKT